MNKLKRAELIAQVLEHQRLFLSIAFRSDIAASWAQLDLTMGQLRAFVAVACIGPMPIGLLGTTLGVGKPAATILVNTLVRHGLVERQEDVADRRRTLVHASAKGFETLNELMRGREELFGEWMRRLSDDDLAALAQGTQAMTVVATASGIEQQKYA